MYETTVLIIHVPGRARGNVRVLAPAKGKSSYRVLWTDAHGRQRERNRTDVESAKAIAVALAEELALEIPPTRASGATVTFGELLDSYLNGDGRPESWKSHRTARRMAETGRRVLVAEDLLVPVAEILADPDQVFCRTVMARAVARGCPPGGSEYHQAGVLLKGVFDAGARTGRIQFPAGLNPMRGLDYRERTARSSARSREARGIRYVTEMERPPTEAVTDLIASADRYFGEAAGTLFGLAAFGGPRIGETLAVRAEQVLDPDLMNASAVHIDRQIAEFKRSEVGPGEPTLSFTSPKWGSIRTTWVAPHVHERLIDLAMAADRRSGPEGLLFPAPRGGPQRRSLFRQRVFSAAATKAGWPRGTQVKRGRVEHPWQWPIHSLRHHYATWALRTVGLPLASVAEFLGHDDPRVTAHMYTKPELAELNAATAAYHLKELS